MTFTGGSWTDERIALLKKLWAEGFSAPQVAKQLGGVTRNAVIGKVHRLGLSGRAKASGPRRTYVKAARLPPQASRPAVSTKPALRVIDNKQTFEEPVARPPLECVALPDEGQGRRTILDVRMGECRWPMGDPLAPGFTFCGAQAVRGSYCAGHAKRAFQATPPAKALARSLRRYV